MIFGDYHMHSFYSKDASGTLEDIVKSAIKKGLLEIGITEHAFLHGDGITMDELKKIKAEIIGLRKKYADVIKIYFGIEANLINHAGDIDVDESIIDQFDYVILGFHKRVKGIKNLFPHLKMFCAKHIEKNTQSYIIAMQKHKNIKILAHLNYGTKVCVKTLAKYASENKILIELNGKRVLFSSSDVKHLLEAEVNFIVNSDSHHPDTVGACHKGENFVEKHCIPHERVVNYDRTTIHAPMISKSLGHIFKYNNLEEE